MGVRPGLRQGAFELLKVILKSFGGLLAALALAVLALVAVLSATEYRPAQQEPAQAAYAGGAGGAPRTLSVVTWNIGYGGLGRESDFFMDGGSQVHPLGRQIVEKNLAGIAAQLDALDADVVFLQEVDAGARRSFGIDERALLAGPDTDAYYAPNYRCLFVPFPLPPIGRVDSGLLTVTKAHADQAQREALPCPFAWPVRTANLKRCLLVSRVPVAGTDRQLVLINLHLEAYDDGAGKAAQTLALGRLMQSEYEKGNYVVAGGDFNQSFPGAAEAYPIRENAAWTPGTLDAQAMPSGWQLVCDLSVPTCRLLDAPLGENTQRYGIDGFWLSPNVHLADVRGVDAGFEFSDHNPVRLEIVLE